MPRAGPTVLLVALAALLAAAAPALAAKPGCGGTKPTSPNSRGIRLALRPDKRMAYGARHITIASVDLKNAAYNGDLQLARQAIKACSFKPPLRKLNATTTKLVSRPVDDWRSPTSNDTYILNIKSTEASAAAPRSPPLGSPRARGRLPPPPPPTPTPALGARRPRRLTSGRRALATCPACTTWSGPARQSRGARVRGGRSPSAAGSSSDRHGPRSPSSPGAPALLLACLLVTRRRRRRRLGRGSLACSTTTPSPRPPPPPRTQAHHVLWPVRPPRQKRRGGYEDQVCRRQNGQVQALPGAEPSQRGQPKGSNSSAFIWTKI
jgi:hypothetical protein